MDWNSASDFMEKFGAPVTILIIGALMMVVPRRRANGHKKWSSYLVAGWQHDLLIEELDEVRSSLLAEKLEARRECDKRIAEYRDLYNTERTMRKELEERFRQVNADRQEDSKLLKQLTAELSDRRRRRTPS